MFFKFSSNNRWKEKCFKLTIDSRTKIQRKRRPIALSRFILAGSDRFSLDRNLPGISITDRTWFRVWDNILDRDALFPVNSLCADKLSSKPIMGNRIRKYASNEPRKALAGQAPRRLVKITSRFICSWSRKFWQRSPASTDWYQGVDGNRFYHRYVVVFFRFSKWFFSPEIVYRHGGKFVG